jgi:hypothetical protein
MSKEVVSLEKVDGCSVSNFYREGTQDPQTAPLIGVKLENTGDAIKFVTETCKHNNCPARRLKASDPRRPVDMEAGINLSDPQHLTIICIPAYLAKVRACLSSK